jgi:hypothetical protein
MGLKNLTNSIFSDKVSLLMFARLWTNSLKRERRSRTRRSDTVTEQVKKLLQEADQRLILMVRG